MECETRNTKCVLCLRPAEEISNENKCLQQKIANLYVIYLKPKLATRTTASVNWASLLKGRTFYCSQFCSECMRNGQKLTTMNDQLIALQCAIQDFIQNLAEEILKYRDDLYPGSHLPTGSVSLSPQQFLKYSAHEIEIKKEDDIIKKEVEIDNIYVEEDEYISIQTSVNSQDPLGEQVDSNDPAGDEDYYCYEELSQNQDSSDFTRETPALLNRKELPMERKNTNSKDMKDVLKDIQSRKLVVSLQRLADGFKRNSVPKKRSNLVKNKRTKVRCTRGKKINFKHIFQQYGYDFDIDGNEVKSVPEETEEKKYKYDSENELDDAIEQQVNRILSATNITSKQVKEFHNLKCTLCDIKFKNLAYFETHMFKKHRRTPAQCTKCEQIFIDREALGIHMKSVHPIKNSLLCAACPDLEKFPNVYEYEIHSLRHTEEIAYDCPKCHETFSNARNYCEHQKSSSCANLGGEFVCEKCDEVFKAKCLLLTHQTVFHKGKEKKDFSFLQCEMCEKPPMRRFNLEDHYATEHTEEFIIPCDICGMSLQNIGQFDEHRKSHRPKVKIPCHLCDKSFAELAYLRHHIKATHTGKVNVTEYVCEKCGQKFIGKKRKYIYHINMCNKTNCCDICGKFFPLPCRLRNHMKCHTDGFPTCTECNKQFETEGGLKYHVDTTHLKKLTVICEICGKVLLTKKGLERHVSHQHSKQNPSYDCKTCGEKFPNEYKKRRHYRLVHVGELVSCQYCSEMFTTPEKQSSHEDSKHWEVRNKDFKCTACEAVFKQKIQRKRHRKLMHPELIISNANKQCPICNKLFHSGGALKSHMRRHERDKDGSFQCELCSRTFLKQQSLTWHMSQDHNIKRNL